MASRITSAFAGRNGMSAKLYGPADTGLNAVDLKTVAATVGSLLDLAGAKSLQAHAIVVIAGTTPGAGSATLDISLWDGPTQITGWIPIGTLAFGDAAGTHQKTVGFGGELAAVANGANWTVGAGLDAVRAAIQVKLRVNVTVAFTLATTATISAYLVAGP